MMIIINNTTCVNLIIIKTIRLKHRLRSRDDVISDSVVGVVCLAGWLMSEKSAVLIDELTNQVTTECNGVALY